MSIKKVILLLATGLSTGVVMTSAFSQFGSRSVSVGGEIFFLPMVCLLIWFGWMIRAEFKEIKISRRRKNVNTRRK